MKSISDEGASREEIMVEIRKTITLQETEFSDLGMEANRPTTRAVGMVVIRNPFAGQFVENLRPLFEAGCDARRTPDARDVKLFDRPAVSYGKGAIIGVAGEMEHGGVCPSDARKTDAGGGRWRESGDRL
jgi:hypothetical protein